MSNFGMGWNDQRIADLRTLYARGLTASQIANEIGGGLSRNAVIGKANRLGLAPRKIAPAHRPRRISTGRRSLKPRSSSTQRLLPGSGTAPVTYASAVAAVDISHDSPHACGFFDRTGCHWPLNDPSSLATFLFCNDPLEDGDRVYCRYHTSMGTETSVARKQRAVMERRENARNNAGKVAEFA